MDMIIPTSRNAKTIGILGFIFWVENGCVFISIVGHLRSALLNLITKTEFEWILLIIFKRLSLMEIPSNYLYIISHLLFEYVYVLSYKFT